MGKTLLAFFITLLIVIVVCTIIAIVRQNKINKTNKSSTVSGADNHVMETGKYSGKYSICKKIGEANAEF